MSQSTGILSGLKLKMNTLKEENDKLRDEQEYFKAEILARDQRISAVGDWFHPSIFDVY